jgi:tetratricopeptide (TPR) repeat protein
VGKIRLQLSSVFLAVIGMVNSVTATETNHLSPSDALIVEGALQYGDGDFDKAIASFTKVLQFDPTNLVAVFDRASVYRAKGEFKKSISDFNSYIRLNPTNALAYKNRASDFAAIGEFEKLSMIGAKAFD